jgi:adenine-specific DNA-methyltransferase
VIKVKAYLEDKEGIKPRSLWKESKYAAALGTTKLINILGNNDLFSYPKSVDLVKDAIFIASDDESTILDFFAGSGKTAHAVIDLNREDNGNRKFILVEIEKYFDNVTKPRIQKVVYSSEWKDGKPQNSDGISHIFKYLILEQYEDTLNNIEFKEAGTVQKTLMDMDGYFLRYMLDFETRDSPCRMNVVKLERPFEYTLRITRDNELYNETVDLVETFNYLLGLKVKWIRTFSEHGTKYRVVHGETLAGQSTTIIWRTTEGLDLAKDKKFIEETILKDPKLKAEQVYINGDFHVEGALPIEPEFQRLMGA